MLQKAVRFWKSRRKTKIGLFGLIIVKIPPKDLIVWANFVMCYAPHGTLSYTRVHKNLITYPRALSDANNNDYFVLACVSPRRNGRVLCEGKANERAGRLEARSGWSAQVNDARGPLRVRDPKPPASDAPAAGTHHILHKAFSPFPAI